MELIVFITVLCFAFFALQTHCTSLEIKLQSSNEQAKGVQLSHPTLLPRKLRFSEEAVVTNGNEAHHSISSTKQKEHVSGKAYQKEKARVRASNRGTRQAWVESGTDSISQYFTMDYSHVRRRRPIHNKSLPVAP